MQTLEVFQSLWAMEQRRPGVAELALGKQFEMIAHAGYDGAAIDFASADLPTARRALPLFQEHGLGCLLIAFPRCVDDLKPVLEMAVTASARFVAINAKVFPFTPEEGARFVSDCLALGRSAGVETYFETHRLTLTTDMLYTLQLLDLVPELELVADLSHFVVAREFPWPVDDFHQELMDRILRRSMSFQGRVASREQAQVQLDFPQHQGWVKQFHSWWEQGMGYWRARAGAGAALNFLCELGPPPYAMTGADGKELSDRWLEALTIKDQVRHLWSELENQ